MTDLPYITRIVIFSTDNINGMHKSSNINKTKIEQFDNGLQWLIKRATQLLLQINVYGNRQTDRKYQIIASEIDSEENVQNNSYTAYIDVIDSRYKILILQGASHPDISAYKSAIEKNKNYTTKISHFNDFNGNINAFQLVVLFGVNQNVNLIKRLKESQIPLLVFELKTAQNKYMDRLVFK